MYCSSVVVFFFFFLCPSLPSPFSFSFSFRLFRLVRFSVTRMFYKQLINECVVYRLSGALCMSAHSTRSFNTAYTTNTIYITTRLCVKTLHAVTRIRGDDTGLAEEHGGSAAAGGLTREEEPQPTRALCRTR